MTRFADFLKGLLALAVILALFVGVPYALITFAGSPVDDVRRILADELLSDDTTASLALRAGLTSLAWLAWAQIALSISVEFIALARGRVAGRASVLPGVQGLARRLVVATTLLVNAFTSTTGATALMPLAVPPPIESVELDLLRPPEMEAQPAVVGIEAPAAVVYTTSVGDTFWSLAESMLGDGLRWSEIRDANLGRTMGDGTVISEVTEVVRAGWELALPDDAVLPLTQSPPAAGGAELAATGSDAGVAPSPESIVVDAEAMPDQLELAESANGARPQMLGRWEVAKGDHFWAIAEETLTAAYGRAVSDAEITPYWQEIIDANRDRLVTADPDLVHPGQTFDVVLPPLADEIVIGSGAAPAEDGASGAGTAEGGIAGGDGTVDGEADRGLGAASVDDRAETASGADGARTPGWTSVDDPASEDTLRPLEPVADGGPIDGRTVALGLFGTAVGGGALIELLRRRRAGATADEDGDASAAGAGRTDPFEARVRPVANTEAVRWLAATNRYLTRQLGGVPADRPPPAVLAMRAGEFGVEVLLDEASAPPVGFVADGGTGAAWRVRADLELRDLEAAARGAQPYSPALLPVGETEAGDLLVDLEQLAVMSLVGDIGTIAGWLATVATSATAMSWSQNCTVIAIGVQTVLGGSNQVRVPTDVAAWADETIAAHTEMARNAQTSTYRQRLDSEEVAFVGGELDGPTIVLLGPGHDDLALRLTEVAELAHSSLVLITTTAVAGHARIELEPGHGVVIPDRSGLRLDFDPIVTGSGTARYAAELLGADGDDHRYADVYDTVRRRPLGPADESDDAVPHHLWAPPVAEPGRTGANHVEEPHPTQASVTPTTTPAHNPTPNVDAGPVAGDGSAAVWPAPDPAPQGSPIDLQGARLEVLEPRPIEARVLVGRPSIVGLRDASSRTEELLVYLATVRGATPDELGRRFLPDVGADGLEPALAEELVRLDAAAGRDREDRLRVWYDEPTSQCWVHDEIASDQHRFVALAALADRADTDAEELACLEAAVGLIDDAPAGRVVDDSYRWLQPGEPERASLDALVADVAHRLGELAFDNARPDVAVWAAERGLEVVPGEEALHRLLMRAAARRDDRQGVEDAYRAAVEAMEQSDRWNGLEPETDALYRQLVDPLTEPH